MLFIYYNKNVNYLLIITVYLYLLSMLIVDVPQLDIPDPHAHYSYCPYRNAPLVKQYLLLITVVISHICLQGFYSRRIIGPLVLTGGFFFTFYFVPRSNVHRHVRDVLVVVANLLQLFERFCAYRVIAAGDDHPRHAVG